MHPVKMMMESKLEVHKDKTLREATEMAYKVCGGVLTSSIDFFCCKCTRHELVKRLKVIVKLLLLNMTRCNIMGLFT